jgi:endonuclease/exonuclease/phosphatase family metal-dependent hydrolase
MVGSFNIARFGESKSAKAVVMDRLMEITYPFDVLAIQEVVSQQEAVVQNFVDKLNTKYGAKFNYVVGPFVGRTNYVERAAYVYDTSRLNLVEQPFMIADPEDKLHREPLVARFQVREDLASNPFSFVMVNLHLDPDSGAAELDHVSDLLNVLESLFKGQEDDVLLVGDFNLNPEKIFGETKFSARPEWKSVLDKQVMTNTRQNQAYDNVLYHVDKTREFLQRQGVIDLRARFRISLEEALEISDHLPVWAAFSLEEAAAQDVAAVETGAVR